MALRPAASGKPAAAVAEQSVEDLVAEFNAKFAVVNEAGKVVVFQRAHDAILGRSHFVRMAFDELSALYLNRPIGFDATAADVWLRHPNRRRFIGGVVFDPFPTMC